MKMMKKMMMIAGILLIIAPMALVAQGQKESDGVELTFMINFQPTEAVTAALEDAVELFEEENPMISIDLIAGSADYEALMKSKMAANDLPDMWSTHGWSVMRYSEYLMPLEDQPWADDLHPAIEPVITDKEGHIYVLPLDVDVAGVAYNKDVMERAGVDVRTIKTWSDLYVAMEKIKAIGVTPVHIGGKDFWTVGNFFDWAAPSVYVTDERNYSGDDLKAGTFDTDKWELLAELFRDLYDRGYLNVDSLTSTYADSARALANGEAALEFYGNYVLAEAWTYNPDANLGFFPVPAYYAGDEPTLISGERSTVGIWKDTEYPQEAKLFLEFLATPSVMASIATANAIPAGLTTAVSDTGRLQDDYATWGSSEAFPYFDREFLPSGMWDTMCSTGSGILSGDMSTSEAAEKMLDDFSRLYQF
ncbi:MAG: ABC transporter substrate-binding protein [Spirochaetia bacterium]|nr:ABC transporter substrate-binding protein [Spirochaetia bacterium]MCF7942346.1 ABC transporter substrate-binding protein [Spirochaetia bacterium]